MAVFSTTSGSSSDFFNTYILGSEVVENPEEHLGERFQMKGYVVEGTVEWVPKNLNFTLEEEEEAKIDVVYYGTIPSAFPLGRELGPESDIEVVNIGKFEGDKVLADRLLVKYPSKYESKIEG